MIVLVRKHFVPKTQNRPSATIKGIGSAVVKELLGAGHKVIGLTRSQEGAKQLTAAGATPHWGRLEDLESLRSGAASADAVIHLAFIHGFSDAKLSARLAVIARGLTGRSLVSSFMATMMGTDLAAIETLGSTLSGSDRPFIITVGTMGLRPGAIASENDAADPASAGGRSQCAIGESGSRLHRERRSHFGGTSPALSPR